MLDEEEISARGLHAVCVRYGVVAFEENCKNDELIEREIWVETKVRIGENVGYAMVVKHADFDDKRTITKFKDKLNY